VTNENKLNVHGLN